MLRTASTLILCAMLPAAAGAEDRWRHKKTKDKATGQVTNKVVLNHPHARLEITCEDSQYSARFFLNSRRLKAETQGQGNLRARVLTKFLLAKPEEEHLLDFVDAARQGVNLPITVEAMLKESALLVEHTTEDGQLWTVFFGVQNLPEEIRKLPCAKR